MDREKPQLGGTADPRALALEANRRLRISIVVAVIGVVALSIGSSLSFWDTVGLSVFCLLLPGLAIAQLPLLKISRLERLPVYLGSAVTIIALGAVGFVLTARLEGGVPQLLQPLPPVRLLVWSSLLVFAGLCVLVPLTFLDRSVRLDRRGSEAEPSPLLELIPRSGRERAAFAGLSICAGVGEEIAYRVYVLEAIQLLGVGPWSAAALSAVTFGALHAYQGPVGTFRTAATGLAFAAPVVVAGTVLPAIVAHTVVDLVGGLVLGPRMLRSHPLVQVSPEE